MQLSQSVPLKWPRAQTHVFHNAGFESVSISQKEIIFQIRHCDFLRYKVLANCNLKIKKKKKHMNTVKQVHSDITKVTTTS